jgi:hypothetical protein
MKRSIILMIHTLILSVFIVRAQENIRLKKSWQIETGYSYIQLINIKKERTGGMGLGCWSSGSGGNQHKSNSFKLGVSKNVNVYPSLFVNFGAELNYYNVNKNVDLFFGCISGKFNEKVGEIMINSFLFKVPLTIKHYFPTKKFFIAGGFYGLIPFSDTKYEYLFTEFRRFPNIVLAEPETSFKNETMELHLTYGWTTSIGYTFNLRNKSFFAKFGYYRSVNDFIGITPLNALAISGMEFNFGIDL